MQCLPKSLLVPLKFPYVINCSPKPPTCSPIPFPQNIKHYSLVVMSGCGVSYLIRVAKLIQNKGYIYSVLLDFSDDSIVCAKHSAWKRFPILSVLQFLFWLFRWLYCLCKTQCMKEVSYFECFAIFILRILIYNLGSTWDINLLQQNDQSGPPTGYCSCRVRRMLDIGFEIPASFL
jgi:hypothetical protein